MPLLSIIIPCYNNGDYLKEMIDCCLRQTFKDWELIIVDDQSTDETTPKVINEYTERDKRIIYQTRDREPKGSVVCRNIGFDSSKGKYIIHFDADDLISDTCFEERVNFMEANPDCDYASFPAVLFFDKQDIPTWPGGKIQYGIKSKRNNILLDFLNAEFPFSCWCNIYKRSSIEKIKWDEKILVYSDFSYIIPCILAGLKHKFSGFQNYDYYYRKFDSGSNMCANFTNDGKCESTLYLFEKTQRQLKTQNDYQVLSQNFLNWTIIHLERLLEAGIQEHINPFIESMGKYYPSSVQKKCKFVQFFSKINNTRIRVFSIDLLLAILFSKKRFLKKALNVIRDI